MIIFLIAVAIIPKISQQQTYVILEWHFKLVPTTSLFGNQIPYLETVSPFVSSLRTRTDALN